MTEITKREIGSELINISSTLYDIAKYYCDREACNEIVQQIKNLDDLIDKIQKSYEEKDND